MRGFIKLTAFLVISALIGAMLPITALATLPPTGSSPGELKYIGLTAKKYTDGFKLTLGVDEEINPRNLETSERNEGLQYDWESSYTEILRINNSTRQPVENKDPVKIRGHKSGTATVTIHLGDKDYKIPVEVCASLNVTSSVALTQLPNTKFSMPLTFTLNDGWGSSGNSGTVRDMKYGEHYSVYSLNPNIIDVVENAAGTTWQLETKAVGSAQIVVSAKDPNDYSLGIDKTFPFTVSNATADSSSTTADSSNSAAAPTQTAPAMEAQYGSAKFTGTVTVGGAKFYTSNNFEAGTEFAIRPENDGGDWWRSPAAFKGARGVYTANEAGVFELTYCDTEGKTFGFMVNTHKRVEKNKFLVPERVPLGAIFSIQSPEGAGIGIWGKDGNFLSGNNGTYIPTKAGKTALTFTTTKYRYTLYLDIVDDTLPADSASDGNAATSSAETPPAAPPPAADAAPPAGAGSTGGIALNSLTPRGRIVLN